MISDLYRHTNTIWPYHLRRDAKKLHDPYELADALRACKSFNDHSPMLIVDGKDHDVVYSKHGHWQDGWGRLEAVFHKNTNKSTAEEAWFDVELEVWLGSISHAFGTHRLLLAINGLIVRPYDGNEWLKFRTGPHKDGTVLHFTLLYDESIPRLLRWERNALDRIEAIDKALERFHLQWTLIEGIRVTEIARRKPDDLRSCRIEYDSHKAAAVVRLPEWFRVGQLCISDLGGSGPSLIVPVTNSRQQVALTLKEFQKGKLPQRRDLGVRIDPAHWMIFS